MAGIVVCIAALMSGVVPALAQSRGGDPHAFTVASIRQNTTGDLFTAANVPRVALQPGGRVTARNTSLRELIVVVHGLEDYQVSGAPGWIDSDRFDIDARADGELSPQEARAMLGTLLANRFALIAHIESRSLPIYALIAVRDDETLGPRLRRSGADCAPPVPPVGLPPIPPPPPPPPGQMMTLLNVQWPRRCAVLMAPGYLSMREMSMDEFAARLRTFAGRPVFNHTGWAGNFDFELQFTPEFLPGGLADPTGSSAPSLFTAVREQLGLRLDSRRGPVDVLIVDRAERPTEN